MPPATSACPRIPTADAKRSSHGACTDWTRSTTVRSSSRSAPTATRAESATKDAASSALRIRGSSRSRPWCDGSTRSPRRTERALVTDNDAGHGIELKQEQLARAIGEERDREQHGREEVPREQNDAEDVLDVAVVDVKRSKQIREAEVHHDLHRDEQRKPQESL